MIIIIYIYFTIYNRTLCSSLLIKNQSERLNIKGLLNDPFIHSKVISYPKKYLPKALEERIKRAHVRQLMVQIEGLNSDDNTSNELSPINISLLNTRLPSSVNGDDSPMQLSPIDINSPCKNEDMTSNDTLLFDNNTTLNNSNVINTDLNLVPFVPIVEKSFKSPRKISVTNESNHIDNSQVIINDDNNLKDDFISVAVPVTI
jgi:hypothetical protein